MTRFALLAAALVVFLGAAPPLQGTFAMQNASQKTRAYLVATPDARDRSAVRLDFWLTPRNAAVPLLDYDAEMTKLLHTIMVSDDFGTFAHVHAAFSRDGHFRIVQRFPKPGLYHVYEDATPHAFGRQVFRFDLPVERAPSALARRRLTPTGSVVRAGPYDVALDRTALSTARETMLTVRVRENGKPAADLHPYLGALAHAVFLNASDLTYVHVHPMALAAGDGSMSGMAGMAAAPMAMPELSDAGPSSPDMRLHVAVREPGVYKLWLQFRGGSQVRVATFVLRAT